METPNRPRRHGAFVRIDAYEAPIWRYTANPEKYYDALAMGIVEMFPIPENFTYTIKSEDKE